MTLTARDDYAFWIPPVLQLEFGAFYPIAIALGVLIGASPAWRTHRVDIVPCLARLD